MTFTDSLTLPVTLTSPPDEAPGIGTVTNDTVKNVRLDWETLGGATEYKWQLDDDTDFSTVPASFEGNTKASSEQLPDLELATTYYWRVRATEPVLSPWSDKWSFTTPMGNEAAGPKLISPEAGASEVPLKPVFQWNAVSGAESYELIVSNEASLDNPVILKTNDYALPTTAWECNIINLTYDTTYYWKVRAISSETYSSWSGVGAFTTKQQPPSPEEPTASPEGPPPPEEPPSSPETSPPAPTTPDWLKYVLGALLATVILLSVIVLVMVRGMRRL